MAAIPEGLPDEDSDPDPAAEFLAREQNQLAGLEDDLSIIQYASDPVYNGSSTPVNGDDIGEFDEPSHVPIILGKEPEKIKKWRVEQRKRLEEKDAEESKKKEEWKQAAKRDLDDWYRAHNELISKTKGANRESAKNAERQFVAESDEIEPGTEWERISKLCEFNPKANRSNRDTSRLKSILLQLKQTPLKKSLA